jgi:hypothetical protein
MTIPANVSVLTTHIAPGGVRKYVVSEDTCRPNEDAFRWHNLVSKGLGKSAWRVYAQLPIESALKTGDLMSALRMGRSGLHKHLQRLESVGLALKAGSGLWRRGGTDLEAVACRLGTAGTAARERAGHQQEREEYRDHFSYGSLRLEPARTAPARQAASAGKDELSVAPELRTEGKRQR